MRHFFPILLLSLCPTLSCLAQEKAEDELRSPGIIVQSGLGFQWFAEPQKLFTLSVERPVWEFWHVGMLYHSYFRSALNYYESKKLTGGYEVGVFSKYFFHGRFSGRKTGLYIGPELRYGNRKFDFEDFNIFPVPIEPVNHHREEPNSKILLRWGVQWQMGHANLELAAPFGVEFFKTTYYDNSTSNETQFVLLPMLQLGIAL